MNSGLFSKYNELFCFDRFNKRCQLSWRSSFDNEKYIVDYKYGTVFYTKTIDDIEKLEQRFVDVKMKLNGLWKTLIVEIDKSLKPNSLKGLIIGRVNSEYYDFCFLNKKTGDPVIYLGQEKKTVEERVHSMNLDGLIVANQKLINANNRYQNLLKRSGIFYNALSLSLIRLIEAKTGFTDCTKQYYAGKLNDDKFRDLFRNKVVSLNFSGREYLYVFDTNYSRIPELKEVCWSDGKITRLYFGENKC